MPTGRDVDVVVPVHNEEAALESGIRRLHSFLSEAFPYRPYQPALPAGAALGEVAHVSGAQFMPGADGLLCDALRWWAVAA